MEEIYNINFPAKLQENRLNRLFSASYWKPKSSGLMGPVTMTPAIQTTAAHQTFQ